MPRLIITETAAAGLEKCRLFLAQKNPTAAQQAAYIIKKSLITLEVDPLIGRKLEYSEELRELIIPFGSSGYVALYGLEKHGEKVVILAFRHQKEAGY